MYARRVLRGSGNTAMCVKQGQPICETPQCEKGPVNNLHSSIGATWHVPGKKDKCLQTPRAQEQQTVLSAITRQTQGNNAHTNGIWT